MPPIQPLPQKIIHRIAAGEVIDSLGSVVRELVENSLDAGANRIQIDLWPEQWRVRVSDNGQGMGMADLQQAALPHSTSKFHPHAIQTKTLQADSQPQQAVVIEAEEDGLNHISSLGFRGEALHSLAQLGQLEICSCQRQLEDAIHASEPEQYSQVDIGQKVDVPPDEDALQGDRHQQDDCPAEQLPPREVDERHQGEEGWLACYDSGGQLIELKRLAIAPGSIVTVSGLFAAWPARRQALPHAAQQLRQIQRLIQRMALAHPQVTWRLTQNDRPWFALWPGPTAQALFPQILRGVAEADLRDVTVELEPQRLAPQIPHSKPWATELSETDSNQLTLLLGLPDRCHRRRPDWITVAVNGRCVRLPELEQTLLSKLRRSLPRDRFPVAFIHIRTHPSQVDWNRHPAKAEIYLRSLSQWKAALDDALEQALKLAPDSAGLSDGRIHNILKAAEQGAGYGNRRDLALPSSPMTDAPHQERSSDDLQPLFSLKALAQVHHTYIVAEHTAGLWLVEQHIAHERVLYEQISERWQCIPLESPLVLEGLSDRQRHQLDRIGVQVEPFGEQLWAVRSAPAPLAQRDDCAEALLELSQGGDLQAAQVATACRTAIRNGQPLSLSEMQSLLDQWQQTRHPQTCPHGRPIYMALAETSLARFFRRNWVIGKSHGI